MGFTDALEEMNDAISPNRKPPIPKRVTTHERRTLTHIEKKVLTFLDSSEHKDRTSSYRIRIRRTYSSNAVRLYIKREFISVSPMILLSLVGKGLLKVRLGKVELKPVLKTRSHQNLECDGYFDNVFE